MGNYGWKWSFLYAVATVGVLTASNKDIIKSLIRFEGINKLIVLANHITKIPRDIAFIPWIIKHVQRLREC